MMRAGTKGRRQALIFMITNSGHDKTSVCYEYHQYGKQLAAGQKVNDAFFAFICSLDEGDDPFKDESCWAKANPQWGIRSNQNIYASRWKMREACRRKKAWSDALISVNGWMLKIRGSVAISGWHVKTFDIESLKGEECFGGLDLSGKRDLTALGLYFPAH